MSTYGPSHMEATLESYRAAFKADVAAGLRSPWVLPFGILAAPLVQLLYLSVPHVRRPWLYQARWLVVIFTVVWNLAVVMPRCSSTNMACAYGVGLACMSFTFQTFHFLVFTRPQFEAERVMRRRRRAVVNGGATANGNETVGRSSARQTANGAAAIPNGAAKADGKDTREQAPPTAVDEDMKEYLAAGYDYYWQPYPAEGTFWERFRWSYHFCMSSRGMGKQARSPGAVI